MQITIGGNMLNLDTGTTRLIFADTICTL